MGLGKFSVISLSSPVRLAEALTFSAGECVAVSGPSGSGKSRFLRVLADLDVSDGEVSLNGIPWSAFTGPDWRARVTYVGAEAGWWGERVGDHFFEADRDVARDRLPSLGLPREALDWDVVRLSTGERQRLALLRALVQEPDVLLLDEPTASLDEGTTGKVEAVLARHLARGGILFLVTHDLAQAARLAGRRLEVVDLMVRELAL